MNYYNKYIKYKSKYLDLKRLNTLKGGGIDILDNYNNINEWFNKASNEKRVEFIKLLSEIFRKYNLQYQISGKYELDMDKLRQWTESQCSDKAIDLATIITKHIRYVQFSEFYEKLIQCVKEFLRMYDKKKVGMILHFRKESWLKSNFWVSHLALEYIFENSDLNVILLTVDEVKDYPLLPLLIIDDMIYSGMQMSENIRDIRIQQNDSELYIITPFTTNRGIEVIKGYGRENITHIWAEVVNTLEELYSNSIMREEFIKYFEEKAWTKPLIYFDHKLADFVSVPQRTMCVGPINTDVDNKNEKLYCLEPPYSDHRVNVRYYVPFIENAVLRDNYCIPIWYKSESRKIVFTIINNNINVEQLAHNKNKIMMELDEQLEGKPVIIEKQDPNLTNYVILGNYIDRLKYPIEELNIKHYQKYDFVFVSFNPYMTCEQFMNFWNILNNWNESKLDISSENYMYNTAFKSSDSFASYKFIGKTLDLRNSGGNPKNHPFWHYIVFREKYYDYHKKKSNIDETISGNDLAFNPDKNMINLWFKGDIGKQINMFVVKGSLLYLLQKHDLTKVITLGQEFVPFEGFSNQKNTLIFTVNPAMLVWNLYDLLDVFAFEDYSIKFLWEDNNLKVLFKDILIAQQTLSELPLFMKLVIFRNKIINNIPLDNNDLQVKNKWESREITMVTPVDEGIIVFNLVNDDLELLYEMYGYIWSWLYFFKIQNKCNVLLNIE